jgi:hypothetical protein
MVDYKVNEGFEKASLVGVFHLYEEYGFRSARKQLTWDHRQHAPFETDIIKTWGHLIGVIQAQTFYHTESEKGLKLSNFLAS